MYTLENVKNTNIQYTLEAVRSKGKSAGVKFRKLGISFYF